MTRSPLSPEVLHLVAARFKALAEPARLHILRALAGGESSVTELGAETGLTQANLSKHLQVLHDKGFVARRKEGLFTYYRLADRDVLKLCAIMCGRLNAEARAVRRSIGAGR